MRDLIVSLAVGTAVGMVFAVMRLPVPAPPSVAGVMGILGIFIGYSLVKRLL